MIGMGGTALCSKAMADKTNFTVNSCNYRADLAGVVSQHDARIGFRVPLGDGFPSGKHIKLVSYEQ